MTPHRLLIGCLGWGTTAAALMVGAGNTSAQAADKKPNIVFMLADNLGYGELGAYGGGILRGAPTPRIDALAGEGMRLLNFNVEAQCTPSRSALMTGRFSIRSGTYEVPVGGGPDGLTLWEVTIAELLSAQGYATGMWGKWHLGSAEARFPTNQGFDEWYGSRARTTKRCGLRRTRRRACGHRSATGRVGRRRSSTLSTYTKRAGARSPGRWGCWTWIGAEPWRRRSRAAPWNSSSDRQVRTSRSTPTFHSHWFTCRRCRIRSSLAGQATAIGPIAWLRWTIGPDRSSTPSRKPASKII